MSEPIRAVYDCMVFVQAALRPQRVHATMQLVEEGAVTLCVSRVGRALPANTKRRAKPIHHHD